MKYVSQGGAGFRHALIFLVAILLFAFAATAQTTNGLSDAEMKGRQLVQEILQETPAENVKQTGTLRIKDSKGTTNIPVTFDTAVDTNYWTVSYFATSTNGNWSTINLMLLHYYSRPEIQYSFCEREPGEVGAKGYKNLKGTEIMAPFADSDFWIADLGLEFFHWPGQQVIKHETRRTRHCTVLESTNPNPSPGAYSRVVSWIDDETHGIVHAEAYDANDKLLKVFDPKSFKKVNGQWELQDMEIRNVQTGSRTHIKFDLNSKS